MVYMETNTATESQIEAAVTAIKLAQDAHAACLKWSHATGRFESLVTERELSDKYIASLEAERAFLVLCGEVEAAEQIGYQIEDEQKRIARTVAA